MRRLLLISTSRTHGTEYLDHCADEMSDLLGSIERVLFVPFALADRDGYAAKARDRFRQIGYQVDSLHDARSATDAVAAAEAVFIGGGNSFRLLLELWRLNVVQPLRDRVRAGMPYMGTSAGANVACPTIKTTNDMPIVEPPTFEALHLVPFQINPHYLDPAPDATHMGETRETRIREYLEENDRTVIGLREGAMLRVDGDRVSLRGGRGARIFRRQMQPEEVAPPCELDRLLAGG